ncbi:hypothetical protein T484DRAFT_1829289 [Baffinella frigidus]|nr:hypothetical protein T484DRAFT_1829289 [Cryptophyta sp. CCMP2293]
MRRCTIEQISLLAVSLWHNAVATLSECLLTNIKCGVDLNDLARARVVDCQIREMEQGAFWAMAPVMAGSAASLESRRNRIFGPIWWGTGRPGTLVEEENEQVDAATRATEDVRDVHINTANLIKEGRKRAGVEDGRKRAGVEDEESSSEGNQIGEELSIPPPQD